ncbi:MAG: hypothetical protein AB7O43_11590 [Hyphomicrobiaceae bacterium]
MDAGRNSFTIRPAVAKGIPAGKELREGYNLANDPQAQAILFGQRARWEGRRVRRRSRVGVQLDSASRPGSGLRPVTRSSAIAAVMRVGRLRSGPTWAGAVAT